VAADDEDADDAARRRVGLTTYLGAWLADTFNASAGDVGGIYAVAGAGAVVGGFAGGALSDRVGKRRVAATSSLWLALFVLLLPTFDWGGKLWAATCVTAFLAALRVAPLQALVTEVVEPAERGGRQALPGDGAVRRRAAERGADALRVAERPQDGRATRRARRRRTRRRDDCRRKPFES
jgi:hypothetical protein